MSNIGNKSISMGLLKQITDKLDMSKLPEELDLEYMGRCDECIPQCLAISEKVIPQADIMKSMLYTTDSGINLCDYLMQSCEMYYTLNNGADPLFSNGGRIPLVHNTIDMTACTNMISTRAPEITSTDDLKKICIIITDVSKNMHLFSGNALNLYTTITFDNVVLPAYGNGKLYMYHTIENVLYVLNEEDTITLINRVAEGISADDAKAIIDKATAVSYFSPYSAITKDNCICVYKNWVISLDTQNHYITVYDMDNPNIYKHIKLNPLMGGVLINHITGIDVDQDNGYIYLVGCITAFTNGKTTTSQSNILTYGIFARTLLFGGTNTNINQWYPEIEINDNSNNASLGQSRFYIGAPMSETSLKLLPNYLTAAYLNGHYEVTVKFNLSTRLTNAVVHCPVPITLILNKVQYVDTLRITGCPSCVIIGANGTYNNLSELIVEHGQVIMASGTCTNITTKDAIIRIANGTSVSTRSITGAGRIYTKTYTYSSYTGYSGY